MQDLRPPAVAGTFYPHDSQMLRHSVQMFLDAAASTMAHGDKPVPKALIVPHAGYIYSGAMAAHAFARLGPARARIRRVVLLGPVHRVPVRGLALPEAHAFATPLGTVAVDSDAIAAISDLRQVVVSAPAHVQEHSLEVQLPFLQSVLDDFTLVPLAV